MYQTCGIRPSPTRSQCSPASMSRRSNASHGCTRAASHARDAPPLARCRRQAPAPLCCLRAGDSPELSSRYPRPLEPPPAQEMRHRSPASGDEPPPPLCHQSTSHPPVSLRQGAPTSPLWTRLGRCREEDDSALSTAAKLASADVPRVHSFFILDVVYFCNCCTKLIISDYSNFTLSQF